MTEITRPTIPPLKPEIPSDFINDIKNAVYAQQNIEKDGEAGLSQKEISLYIQETYGVDQKTADKIAAYALRQAGGEISNGAQLADALGLETLEKTATEQLQDAIADLTGRKPSADTARIDLLEILVNLEVHPIPNPGPILPNPGPVKPIPNPGPTPKV